MRPREGDSTPPDDEPRWVTDLRDRILDLDARLVAAQGEIARLHRALAWKAADIARVVSHTLIVLALLGAYVALTLHGDDGTAILTLLGGYIAGAAVEKVSTARAQG